MSRNPENVKNNVARYCDLQYPTSNEGLVKIPQAILSILSLACLQASVWCYIRDDYYCSSTAHIGIYFYFQISLVFAFIFAIATYAMFMLKIRENVNRMPFQHVLLIILCIHASITISVLLSSCLMTGNTLGLPGMVAATLLGILTAVAYALDMYLIFNSWRLEYKKKNDANDIDEEDGNINNEALFSGEIDAFGNFATDPNEPALHGLKLRSSSQESIQKDYQPTFLADRSSAFQNVNLSFKSSVSDDDSHSAISSSDSSDEMTGNKYELKSNDDEIQ